ncbi:hypothetical protein [Marivita hallyeonensis]|nr:hypothetical protein [Marivita hallyeonensis]
MKADSRDAAVALMEQLKPQIMGMNGLHEFINVMNEDGSGYVISVTENKDTSDANADKVRELWGAFSDHLEAAPEPHGYDVMANWKN